MTFDVFPARRSDSRLIETQHESELIELPFDQYQRYKVVQEVVRLIKAQQGARPLRVLDVGGVSNTRHGQLFFPIAHFLPEDETMVLDVQDYDAPNYLRVNGDGPFPLADASFDVVVSCDTLEHVRPERRPAFLGELLRVARQYVVLAAPFDSEDTRLAEQIFYDFHLRRLGVAQPQLHEHRLYGLPNLKALCEDLESRGLPYVEFPSGYLYNWLLMMVIKDYVLSLPDSTALHTAIDRLYNRHFFASDQRAPAYRHVLVISLQGEQEVLGRIAQRFGQAESSPWEAVGKAGLAQFLLQLVALADQGQQAEHIDLNQDLYDGTVGEILPGKTFGQTFVSHQPNLCRIDVLLATYCRINTCDLTFRLRLGSPGGEEVTTITVPGVSVQDNKWHPFLFPPLLDSKGRAYYFSLESANAAPGNALTAYRYSASGFGGWYEDGRPRDGSLTFRTYYLAPTPDEEMLAELIALRRELQERTAQLEQPWWARLMNLIRGQ
jgi:SAM-dependent methyltransferase